MVQSPAAKRVLCSASQFESLLRHCIESRSLTKTQRVHACVVTSGVFSSIDSAHLRSQLTKTYAFCGQAPLARELFDDLPRRSSFWSNGVMRSYVLQGLYHKALDLFIGMDTSEECRPNQFTYTLVFKACSALSFLDTGSVFHGKLFAVGLDSDAYVQNSLISLYMNCGETDAADKVFNGMLEPTVVS